jgi:pantothenate kinase type III
VPGPLVVLDVGNTNVKLVEFERGGLARRARVFPAGGARTAIEVAESARGSGPVVVVGVRDDHLRGIARRLKGRLALAGRDFEVPLVNRTRRPRETGLDRLCAALAAHARARGAAAVVGVGTAITADAVDAAGGFLGGAIAPGMAAAELGLRRAAPRLPGPARGGRVRPVYPGRTTAEAMGAGLLLGFAGLVDRLSSEATAAARASRPSRRRGTGSVPVFLHGGDAAALLPLLARSVIHAPHLVAEGARLAWLASEA